MISAGLAHAAAHFTSLGHWPSEVLLRLHALNPDRYPALLESSAPSLQGNNVDILMAFPRERLEWRATSKERGAGATEPDFLSTLNALWRAESKSASNTHQRAPASAVPTSFTGGWFVYLSYELAQEIEPSLALPMAPDQLLALAIRIPAAMIRHADSGECWLMSESPDETAAWLDLVRADLARSAAVALRCPRLVLSEDAPEQFLTAVRAAQLHIQAGDIYQANLSRGWYGVPDMHDTSAVTSMSAALYARLKQTNPAPFAGIARLDSQHWVVSSSPERLLESKAGWVSTRPIAGTRPRHADPQEDQRLVAELRAHPKERAEHIMLLDLERSDLGRICEGGSVEVNEYMTIESYAHVHHIVSNVRGRLRSGVTPGQAIAAVFPGGTITGCPKVRCMQIIADQEANPRGAYTGSMGYLNRDGSMDLNILIRTLEIHDASVRFRAGAGVVADSIAERELDETRSKAKGLLRALTDPAGVHS